MMMTILTKPTDTINPDSDSAQVDLSLLLDLFARELEFGLAEALGVSGDDC